MSVNRRQYDHFQKAAIYDMLAQYYKYMDPVRHMKYYQKHLQNLTKAIYFIRTDFVSDNDASRQQAMIRVLHASPDTPNVDVYVNGTRILKDFSYKQASVYFPLQAGKYQIDFYPAGTMVSAVISKKVIVELGRFYTLAAGGPASNLRLFSFADQQTVPVNETKVRFIHLSPDAPAVDIAVKKGDVVFPNVAFKQATTYLGLTPMTVNLEARAAGSESVVLDLPRVLLKPNKVYTAVVVGLVKEEPGLEVIFI